MKPIIGKIVSTKMTKTVVVEVERAKIHPLYKKIVKKTKRIKAHSEDSSLKLGDMVKIASVKPLSKEKHFRVIGKV